MPEVIGVMVSDVTHETYDRFIRDRPSAVLHLWAAWNRVDDAMRPIIDALSERFADNVNVGRVNVDSAGNIEMLRQIGNVPTVALYHDGELIDLIVGLRKLEHLLERVEAVMNGRYEQRFKKPWWRFW